MCSHFCSLVNCIYLPVNLLTQPPIKPYETLKLDTRQHSCQSCCCHCTSPHLRPWTMHTHATAVLHFRITASRRTSNAVCCATSGVVIRSACVCSFVVRFQTRPAIDATQHSIYYSSRISFRVPTLRFYSSSFDLFGVSLCRHIRFPEQGNV